MRAPKLVLSALALLPHRPRSRAVARALGEVEEPGGIREALAALRRSLGTRGSG